VREGLSTLERSSSLSLRKQAMTLLLQLMVTVFNEREGRGDRARYGSAPSPIAVLPSSLILTQGLLCTHKTDDNDNNQCYVLTHLLSDLHDLLHQEISRQSLVLITEIVHIQ
jgi:hypothetical protein